MHQIHQSSQCTSHCFYATPLPLLPVKGWLIYIKVFGILKEMPPSLVYIQRNMPPTHKVVLKI